MLRDCVFEGPVDFYDSVFSGRLVVERCRFEEGTNLLGGQWIEFHIPPIIRDNAGKLDLIDV